MSYQPHYIASFEDNTGLHTYYEPFIAPEKAFPILEDAYCWRGKVKRNPGYDLLGRLRRSLINANMGNLLAPGAGTFPTNIFNDLGLGATEPNAQLQPGTVASPITITIAAPIGQTLIDNAGIGSMTIVGAGPITSAFIDYNDGTLILTFSGAVGASATVFTGSYFPGLPVMGLRLQELPAINSEEMIAFDTKYAYKFNQTTKLFNELVPGTTWTGTNSNFFWSTNYFNDAIGSLFWATNTHMAGASNDPIRYYNTATWTNFVPKILLNATTGLFSYLYNAEIILPYKDRLIFLNTWEGPETVLNTPSPATAVNFPRRVRWSQNGTPLITVDPDAYRQDIIGKGGYLDAPSPNEVIVSAEFIKDTLLVKFERSSWKLVYTGNETLPFVFQQINKELGCESKFSLVPFDKGVYAIANYGITIDDSVNVERVDLQIPNTIFSMGNLNDGTIRVQGIRDYFDELIYWTYVQSSGDIVNPTIYPNRVLVHNYRNNSYGIFKDSFTTYGYYQFQHSKTWAELTDFTWAQWKSSWNSGVFAALFPNIAAGNQHGFVEIINMATDNIGNDPSLYISEINFLVDPVIFTIPNHNLEVGDIVQITGIIDDGGFSPVLLNDLTYMVNTVINANQITLNVYVPSPTLPVTGFYNISGPDIILVSTANVYIGLGVITKINNFNIVTKVFAPFYEAGSQCRLGYIDFLCDKTTDGEFISNIFIDEDSSDSLTDSNVNTCLVETPVINTKPDNLTLIPFQANQDKIWHRQFVQTVAQNFQIQMTMSPEQNADLDIANSDFQLHAVAFYLSKNSRLTQ